MALRSELLSVARAWTSELSLRPGVVGVFLYGSLAGDPLELTAFSDVDVALALDETALPEHFAEHRLNDGTKTDTTLLAASTLRGWCQMPPEGLFAGHWTNSLFLRALTQGSSEILLYDPTGLVADVQRALPTYTTLARSDTRRWLADFRSSRLEKAAQEPEKVAELLHPGWIRSTVEYSVGCKRFPEAAVRLGLPELIPLMQQWHQLYAPAAELLEPLCLAREALGQTAIAAFYEKLPLPGTLEIRGSLPVFWQGNRVHTVERIQAELPVTLRWSQEHRAEGDFEGALSTLWPCDTKAIRTCTQALCDAVAPLGYDITALTDAFLTSAALSQREEAVVAATTPLATRTLSKEAMREILTLAQEALVLLETAFPPPT